MDPLDFGMIPISMYNKHFQMMLTVEMAIGQKVVYLFTLVEFKALKIALKVRKSQKQITLFSYLPKN